MRFADALRLCAVVVGLQGPFRFIGWGWGQMELVLLISNAVVTAVVHMCDTCVLAR
jgi:hypothetical protein